MTVTLLIGQEEIKVDNSLLRKSQLFKEGINDLGQRAVVNSDREDVDIVVSARYLPVIDIYLDFINKISYDEEGKVVYPDSLRVINNIETLILCFYMESFFGDSAFLVYLMGQAYNMWNEFLPHIEGLPGERLIYLYTPYEFVPWHHIDTPSFFKEWLAINGNTEIVLNGKYHYFTEVVYYPSQQLKQLKVYHTVDGREVGGVVGKGYEAGWYEDGKSMYQHHYKNGQLDGPWQAWYDNWQPKERGYYKNGQRDGLWEEFYPNSQPKYIRKYSMDRVVSQQYP